MQVTDPSSYHVASPISDREPFLRVGPTRRSWRSRLRLALCCLLCTASIRLSRIRLRAVESVASRDVS